MCGPSKVSEGRQRARDVVAHRLSNLVQRLLWSGGGGGLLSLVSKVRGLGSSVVLGLQGYNVLFSF